MHNHLKAIPPHLPRAGAGFKPEFSIRGDGRHWQLLRRIIIWVRSIIVETVELFAASFSTAFVKFILNRRVVRAERFDVMHPLHRNAQDELNTAQIKQSLEVRTCLLRTLQLTPTTILCSMLIRDHNTKGQQV